MTVADRQKIAEVRGVSERTLKRLLPELELAGRIVPVSEGGGRSPRLYDLDQVNHVLNELEATRRMLRNSNRWKAAHRDEWGTM